MFGQLARRERLQRAVWFGNIWPFGVEVKVVDFWRRDENVE